jgi:hypothetical protein
MRDLYPARAGKLASRVFGGEAVVMNPADSTLFNLNETATAIWLAADGRTSLRQIVEREICSAWEIDPEAALEDAERFTRELAGHSILLLSAEPAAEAPEKP